MGKTGKRRKSYSAEFKIGVITDMREHRLGYNKTIRKYQLGGVQSGGARNMLRRWERIYLEEGAEGLIRVFNKTLKSVLLGRRIAASGHCR